MDKKSLELLSMEFQMATRALTDVNRRFRKVALPCKYRTLSVDRNGEWDRCNHEEHSYAGMSITHCNIENCPLTAEKIEIEVKRMDEDCWDTGLKPWFCNRCQIGILEIEIDKQPEKCPQCGNKNLKRMEDD